MNPRLIAISGSVKGTIFVLGEPEALIGREGRWCDSAVISSSTLNSSLTFELLDAVYHQFLSSVWPVAAENFKFLSLGFVIGDEKPLNLMHEI